MKPAPFDYVRAGSVEDAVAALAAANSGGEGKVIAGGQSLMPLLALRPRPARSSPPPTSTPRPATGGS